MGSSKSGTILTGPKGCAIFRLEIKGISMNKVEYRQIKKVLESAFLPLNCKVKYWKRLRNKYEYISFGLSDSNGNPVELKPRWEQSQKIQVMCIPERLKFWVFHFRNHLRKEHSLEFSISDEMIEKMIG